MSSRGNVTAASERERVAVPRPELVTVSEATPTFLIVKILTTAMGKAVSDVRGLARDPPLAVLVGPAAVIVALVTPLRAAVAAVGAPGSGQSRILSGFVQPILFLFVLGYGLSPVVGSAAGFEFTKFVYPGIEAVSVVTTAIFSAMSIVWDREFGFLSEMLVAPVSRSAIVIGTTAGGASIATVQSTVMVVLAPLVGVILTPVVVVQVILIELLMAVSPTAFGAFVASRIEKLESVQVVMQLVLFPMLFLSGAMFPLSGLPTWLAVLTRINPLTYAIAPLRKVVFLVLAVRNFGRAD